MITIRKLVQLSCGVCGNVRTITETEAEQFGPFNQPECAACGGGGIKQWGYYSSRPVEFNLAEKE